MNSSVNSRQSSNLQANLINLNSIILRRNILNYTDASKQSTGPFAKDPRVGLFREIKKGLDKRRNRSQKELFVQSSKIREQERLLSNIVKKFSNVWKKIQNRITFLSLLRRSLHNTRNFGIRPRKIRSNFTLDLDAKPSKKWYIIYPDNILYQTHITIMMFIMLYLIIFFPLDLAFGLDDEYKTFKVLTFTIYGYFFLDILGGFFMAFEISGRVEDDIKKIAWNYITGWLIVDLIATIPLDLVPGVGNFKFRGLFKLPRLLRIINSVFQGSTSKKNSVSLLAENMKRFFSSAKTIFIFKSLVLTAGFVHIVACLWVFLLGLDDDNWFSK